MNRQMAAAILEHYMPKRNIHNKNKVDHLAYATAINALRREDALIDEVLEIVKQKWTECDSRYGELNEIRAAMNTAKDIYKAIEALKGADTLS